MSTCEINAQPGPGTASRVMRFQRGEFRWQDVPVQEYKPAGAHFSAVCRMMLVGDRGEATKFHLRYFEIAPGGYTSRENHRHEHVVFVLRGSGTVLLGEERQELGYGDVVYVAPYEIHQFHNPSTTEPFGFLCLVDAERDLPTPAGA